MPYNSALERIGEQLVIMGKTATSETEVLKHAALARLASRSADTLSA